jgi:uncharacterized protein (TIGR02147 family)
MDGQRNLTSAMASRFASAAGLEGDAARYFCEVVVFNQSDNVAERNKSYAKITGFRRYLAARPLEAAHAAYHSTWYLPAIRELVARRDFKNDPHWIAAMLRPQIAPADAARGLHTLLELGLLKRDGKKIVQAESLVSTGPEVRSLNIANYHRTMMQRAADAIEEVPSDERDISSLTLCLGAGGTRRLKERIQRFRRELLELSATETDPRQVIQINFQLFPLSRESEP